MTSPARPANRPLIILLLVTTLLGACSGGPQSQAIESGGPSVAPASAAPSVAPPSAEPASEAPSEAPLTPEPTTAPTSLAVPAKPAKVTWKPLGSQALAGGQTRERYRVSWTAPDGAATSFTVFGVTTCLREAKQYNEKPCLVKGMKIPKSTLKLIAQVPGSARTVDIAWKVGEIGPGPYFAVLVRASNDAGDSIFTIAWSADVCWQCTY